MKMLVPSATVERTDPAVAHRHTHREHLEHLAHYLPSQVPTGTPPEEFLVFGPGHDSRLAIETVGRDNKYVAQNGTVVAIRGGKIGIVPPQHKHEPWAQPFLR